jgi:hypothetical protein
MDDDPNATRARPPRPPAPAGETPDAQATRARVEAAQAGDGGQATVGASRARPAEAPAQDPPVWSPASPTPAAARAGNLRLLVVAALVVVAGGGFAAGWLSRGSPTATPTATTLPLPRAPFVVTSVAVRRGAGRLACPAAVAHLSATMTADHGGGTITYDWLLPHHTVTAPARVTLSTDQSKAVATLAYTITGRAALTGSATLHVISPLDVYSAPLALHYTCSSTKPSKSQ